MSTVHSKSKNNNSHVKNQAIEYNAVKNTWLNAVIEQKKFNITKIVDDCYVRAYLSVKLPESSKKITVTVWKEDYIGSRLTPWINFKNKNIMPLLRSETISNLNAVLTYTIPGQCSLQGRINSEEFRHSNKALNKIMMSVLEIADGLKYLHKMGYAHMNIKASAITIVHDDTIKIDNFQFLSPINTAQRGTSITR